MCKPATARGGQIPPKIQKVLFSKLIWKYKNPQRFMRNLVQIALGQLSFVGIGTPSPSSKKVKGFILRPQFNQDQAFDLQAFIYMKSYRLSYDLLSVWNQLHMLDNDTH